MAWKLQQPSLCIWACASQGFDKEFAAEIPHYRGYFDDADAHRYPIHGDWNDKLTMMEKLIICRCLRADKVC